MTKIKYFALIISMLFSNQIFSQIKISGEIKDKKNNPIEYVEIQLQNKDSIIFKSELTNAEGKFILEAEQGEYSLIVRQLGVIYHNQKINVNQDIYIGIINITEKEQKLQEVIITSKKKLIERKVDRLIFNVENSISASGGDAIDALKVTPSIRVQNDAISMIGKSDVSIMIDDRLMRLSGDDLINFLRTIQADNIKSIEVISTPPAKYDAEGNSGIVNIRLKKAKIDSWNASLNSSYKQAFYSTGTYGGSFNYQKNKLAVYSNLNYLNGSSKRIENDEIYYPNQIWITDFNKRFYSNAITGNVGVDYKVKKNWLTGIQFLGSGGKPLTKENDFGKITNQSSNQLESSINTDARNEKKNSLYSLNWHNIIDIDTIGRKITTDIDYFNFNNDNNRNFDTKKFDVNNMQIPTENKSSINFSEQKIINYSAKIDFEHPLKWAKLSYGTKFSFTNTKNNLIYYDTTNGITVLDNNQSNSFNFKENTESLYLSGNKKFGKEKWESQFGVRMENTKTIGYSQTLNQTNTNSYLQFFPTAYIQYTLNENHIFTIDYGRRIERPNYNSLNPFKLYSSKYSYTEGNPFLLPQFSNSIEFRHTYKYKLFTSLFLSKESQGFGEVPYVDISTNTNFFTQLNYFKSNKVKLSEYYIFSKYTWLESNSQLDLYYSISKYTINTNYDETKGLGFTFSSDNTIVLNKSKTYKVGINYAYQSAQNDLLYENKSASYLDLSFKCNLLKEKLQFTFVAQDIFRTNKERGTTKVWNIQQINNAYSDLKSYRFSLVYKFGSQKINAEERAFGNEDEKNRTDK